MDAAEKRKEIKEMYYDPDTGFGSVEKFWLRFRSKFKKLGIRKKQVAEVLGAQEITQVFKRKPKREFYTIVSPSVRNNYQMDLLDIHQDATFNRGYRWMMVCVDVFSRYAVVIPMKRKTNSEVLRAYKEITRKMGVPKNLNTDLEPAVMGGKFQALLKKDGTSHWANPPEKKFSMSIAERLNRTIREYLRVHFRQNKTRNWIDYISRLIHRYNIDVHRMIRAKPIDIWEGKAEPNQTINRPVFDIDIGDQVRFLKKYEKFTKISAQKVWSKNVYTVVEKEGKRYKIVKNSDKTVSRWEMPNDLQKLKGKPEKYKAEEDVPTVSKAEVVTERARRRQRRALAKEGISEETIIEGPRLRKRKAKPKAEPKPKRKPRAKKPTLKAKERFEIEKFLEQKKVGSSLYFKVRWKGYDSSYDKFEPMKDLKTKKYGVGVKEFQRLRADFDKRRKH